MLRIIRNRLAGGNQAIRNIRKPGISEKFRGLPALDEAAWTEREASLAACPTGAIGEAPLTIDLGKCLFCGACERACGGKGISFTNEFHLATAYREWLVAGGARRPDFYRSPTVRNLEAPRRLFSRSLKFRQVSAGGCAACELELNACSNINFDMGRFGIEFAASPRHADGIVVTGPLTKNMARALDDAWSAVPEPKLLILAGACSISGGIYADSEELDRGFLETHRVDLFVPGCPPHPLVFINAVLDLVGRR